MSCGLIQMGFPLCYTLDEHTSNAPWTTTCDTVCFGVNDYVRGSVKSTYIIYRIIIFLRRNS